MLPRIKNYLRDYLGLGGFPEVVLKEDLREKILKEYFDTIFFRDFVERHELNSELLEVRREEIWKKYGL